MKQTSPYLIIILAISSLFACQNETHLNLKIDLPDSAELVEMESIIQTDTIINPGDYTFNNETSTVTGTLKTELFYGVPNYGESPETDEKEYPYILVLDKPIDVVQTDCREGRNITRRDIREIQLAPQVQNMLKNLKGKKITVKGEFFGAFTGHHHKELLMRVFEVR